MKLILHFVKKDVVAVRIYLATFVAFLVLYAFTELRPQMQHEMFLQTLPMLLPLCCWALVISLIQQESLIGTKPYWMTRPFNWRILLPAKALFLLAFVNLPVFLYQIAVLEIHGFSLPAYLPALLARQVFMTIFLILPAVLLGATTGTLRGAVSFALILCVIPLTGIITFNEFTWATLEWIRNSAVAAILLCGATLIIGFQYIERRTSWSRIGVLGLIALILFTATLPPGELALAIDNHFGQSPMKPDGLHITLGTGKTEAPGQPHPGQRIALIVPLRIEGLNEFQELHSQYSSVELRADGITTLHRDWSPYNSVEENSPGQGRLIVSLTPRQAEMWKALRARLSVSTDLLVNSNIPVSQLWGKDIPGLGICRPIDDRFTPLCLTPSSRRSAPYSTSPWFRPLERAYVNSTDGFKTVQTPNSIVRKTFELDLARVGDYIQSY